MESPCLLDTDILSELFKGHAIVKNRATDYIRKYNKLTLSQISKYEILKGLKSKDAIKQIKAFSIFCEANIIIQITDDVIIKAADIFADLRKQGITISDADILVASMTITNNLALITNNTKHFTNIPDLKLDNWKL